MSKKVVVAENVGSDLVPVVLYETIERLKKARGGVAPPSILVNKIAPLVSFRLREKRVIVPVPYAWYRFGTEIEEVPREISYLSDEDGKRTLMDWDGDAPELYPGDRSAEAIRTEITALVERYSGEGDAELAVDEVYDYAPFDFQRDYRALRICLVQTGRGSREQGQARGSDPWVLLTKALEGFPFEQFPVAARYVDPMREVVKLAWNVEPARDRRLMVEVVEEFWSMFCSYLRVHESGHSPNISIPTIQKWRALAERDRARFERILGDGVVNLSTAVRALSEDATLGPILERRLEEQKEEAQAIDEALEDADELKRLLADIHKVPAGG